MWFGASQVRECLKEDKGVCDMVGEVPLSMLSPTRKVLGVRSLVGDNTDQGGDVHKRL